MLEDAEIVLVAFGTVSRICRAVVEKARQLGIPAGLFGSSPFGPSRGGVEKVPPERQSVFYLWR